MNDLILKATDGRQWVDLLHLHPDDDTPDPYIAIRGDGVLFMSIDREDPNDGSLPDGAVALTMTHLVTPTGGTMMGPGPAGDLLARVVGHRPS